MAKPARKKPGKPRMKKGTRVTDRERVCMYVTTKEAELVRAFAERERLSVSNYLRWVVLKSGEKQ